MVASMGRAWVVISDWMMAAMATELATNEVLIF